MKLTYRVVMGVLALNSMAAAALQRPAIPYFPDLPDHKTLVCDFHTHTVFSDGLVWPTVRVDEAWREGLDVLVLSDHIEYQPHKEDLPTRYDRPYEIALPKALEKNVLLIKGAEITKDTPPGHYNAVFVNEIAPIFDPNVLSSVRVAAQQKAFVFWNHHTWQGVERGQWESLQTTMVENKWLHGLEVANGESYYPLAHRWCLEKGLTLLGNSDIHDPSLEAVYTPQTHRTLTLVLARQRSVESIREALFAGRTLVWQGNRLIGRQEDLEPLYEASVAVSPVHYTKDGAGFFLMSNKALIDLELERTGKIGPAKIMLPARSTVSIKAALSENAASQGLSYTVKNLLISPEAGLPVKIQVATAAPAVP